MDDRVLARSSGPGLVRDRQVQHGRLQEAQVRVSLARDGNHLPGDVDSDDIGMPVRQEPGHMPRAAADIGKHSLPGQVAQGRQQSPVERLVTELAGELVGVRAGHGV
jgi:hypothetical protein